MPAPLADNGHTPFPVAACPHPVFLNAPPTSAAFAQCVPAIELPTHGPAVPAALFVASHAKTLLAVSVISFGKH